MTCPSQQCLTRIEDSYDGDECPYCGCHLFPTRPFDEPEGVRMRPVGARRRKQPDMLAAVNGRLRHV